MKEQANCKKNTTDASTLPEVTSEDEKALLGSLKAEAASFVPDALPKVLSATQQKTSVSPEEEKIILTSLKLEAAHFVPDKLQDILKACHIDQGVDEASEEDIVKALEGEGQAFTPHALGSVEKATGTYNPYYDQADLALKEKVKNEGNDIVPDVESKVYAETGVKRKRFSFKNHWIAWTSGLAVAAASIATIVVVSSGAFQTVASGSYVSVSITPASYAATTSSVLCAYSATTSSGSVNSYTPSWDFSADKNNLVSASSLTPANYSAKLVGVSLASSKQAYEVAQALVAPSYEKGYLETKDPSVKNVITINVLSSQSDYESKYADAYKTSINNALTGSKIYAEIRFNVVDLSTSLTGVNETTAQKLVRVYWALNQQVGLAELKAIPSSVLDALDNLSSSLKTARLSSRALQASQEAMALSYAYYAKTKTTTLSKSDYENDKATLIGHAGSLPWATSQNLAHVQAGLTKDAYYFMGDSIGGTDGGSEWHLFQEIRGYLMSTREKSASDYVSYLAEVTAASDLAHTSDGVMPDGYNNDRPDQGGHEHGDGPNSGNWGPGGGDWTSQTPPPPSH